MEQESQWRSCASDDGRWQIPLEISPLPSGDRDAVSPYGYSGIHIAPSLSAAEIAHHWADSLVTMKHAGLISVFLRFAPFLQQPYDAISSFPGLELLHVSDTILIPLTADQPMWASMKGRARTAIRKATTAGMTCRIDSADQSLAKNSHPFRQLYAATMARLDAAAQYRFSDRYFDALLKLGDRLKVVSVIDQHGSIGASCLVMLDETVAHYHLSASAPDAARQGANNLMIWSLMQWAHSAGLTSLHLGGGVHGDDSLMRFKDSFGGRRVPFCVGRIIVNADSYSKLTHHRAQQLGTSDECLRAASFFPAYRIPGGNHA